MRNIFLLAIIAVFFVTGGVRASNLRDFPSSSHHFNIPLTELKGKELVPLRKLGESRGWRVNYLHKEKEVIIKNENKEIRLAIGQKTFQEKRLKNSPEIIEGRTYLDLTLAEALLKEMHEGQIPQLMTALYPVTDEIEVGEDLPVRIKIKNISSLPYQLKYNSGQLYDLYLYQKDKEVWRWSRGKFFTMALIQKEIKPGEEFNYEVKVPGDVLKKGDYLLTGEIKTANPMNLNQAKISVY